MAEAHVTTKANSAADVKARFGNFLRQARENAGLSIEAVAQETKISKQFIVYLETGSVESLPGQVFGRGFIKNIARYLRSDSSEMLRLYDACWGIEQPTSPETHAPETGANMPKTAASAEEVVEAAPKIVKRETQITSPEAGRKRIGVVVPAWLVRGVMSPHVRLGILGTIAAVMVLGVFGRWMSAHMKRQAVQSSTRSAELATNAIAKKTATDDQMPMAEVAPAEVVPVNVVEKSIATPVDANTVAVKTETATTATLPSVKEEESPLQVQQGSAVAFDQILELKISSPVEIKMTIDGKKQENTSFKADQHRFTFHERAEMMISDASAVEIIYNGKSLGVLGNKGRKRRIYFQAKPSESDFPH